MVRDKKQSKMIEQSLALSQVVKVKETRTKP